MRTRLLLTAALLALASLAQEGNVDFGMQLNVYNALFPRDRPDPTWNPTLILDVRREGGEWLRVLGKAEDYNVATHLGYVQDAQVSANDVTLAVEMMVQGDPWIPGGKARYLIKLTRGADGTLRGTHSSRYRGIEIKGKVEGFVLAKRSLGGPNFVPVAPGEHPRLLFRKSDLPSLRKKAETPMGKAYLAASTDGYNARIIDMQGSQKGPDTISLGIKYQLTGDKRYAENAMAGVEAHMDNRLGGSGSGKRAWGPRLEMVGLTYDLCCDGWPAGFRARVEGYMRLYCHYTFFDQFKVASGEMGWSLWSHAAQIYAGAAIMGLALAGEPGTAPGKPISPSEAERIAPIEGYEPGKGVPVVAYDKGDMPSEWLYTPALDFMSSGDPCMQLGGCERARPELGTKMDVDGSEVEFKALPREMWVPEGGPPVVSPRSKAQGTGCINLQKLAPYDMATTVFYTVLKNDRKRTIKVTNPSTKSGKPLLVLNGNVLHDGRVVEIDAGLYPLLVMARLGTKWDWLKIGLTEATPRDIEDSRDELAKRQGEYRDAYRDWQVDDAQWKATRGQDVRHLLYARMGEFVMRLFIRGGFGTGGYQRPFYFADTLELVQRYSGYHRSMYGDDPSPYDDVSMFLPRKVVSTHFMTNGVARAQSVSGPGLPNMEDYAYLFSLAPADMKPAVLWAWNRQAGAEGVEKWGNVLMVSRPEQAFVHYPADMRPVGPHWTLPSCWECDDFGWYLMRSGWKSDDDFTTQVFLNANAAGASNAGTFRIYGLGRMWADMGWGHQTVGVAGAAGGRFPDSMSADMLGMRSTRYRFEESVVLFPQDKELNDEAAARLTHREAYPDGAVSMTMDMSDVYASAAKVGDRKMALIDRFGLRRDTAFVPSGVSGWRAVAVDYSGKSGAPCLFVLVDDIKGAKETVWTWQYHADLAKLKVAGNTYTFTEGDATMKATFVAPEGVKLSAEGRMPQKLGAVLSRPLEKPASWLAPNATGSEGTFRSPLFWQDQSPGATFTSPLWDVPYPVQAVFAEGGSTFICIATIQRGDAPEVKTEGVGLDAVVTVGKRTISFKGNRIVLGDA